MKHEYTPRDIFAAILKLLGWAEGNYDETADILAMEKRVVAYRLIQHPRGFHYDLYILRLI
jgi:hypothetical protein